MSSINHASCKVIRVPLYEYIRRNDTIFTLLRNYMTEYDYSPEAYERYLASQQRISKWVATTEGYRNEYGNALTVPPSQTGSSTQPRGQLLGPQSFRSSHSQYIQKAPHSQPQFTTSSQRSAVDLRSQCLQNSDHGTSSRSSAPFVSSQSQQPRVSRHGCSTNVRIAPSQHRDSNPTKTSTTYVAVSHPTPSQHRDIHTTVKTSTTHAAVSAVSHPKKPLIPSQHASNQPEAHAQHSQDAKVASHRSIASVSPVQKAPLRHDASTPQLEIATCQAPPTYMLTIPPSEKPTYVYAPSGWVPSAGLVIVPSKGRSTSIVISPPASHAHIPMPQIQRKGHIQPTTQGAVSSFSANPQPSPHASSSQAIYPPVAYVPVPVVIIERERRSKNVKKSRKKDKQSRSKARS